MWGVHGIADIVVAAGTHDDRDYMRMLGGVECVMGPIIMVYD